MSISNFLQVLSLLPLTVMAQDASSTNPLDSFIGIAQSIASKLDTSTASPSSTTLSTITSGPASTAASATPISSSEPSTTATPSATDGAQAVHDTGLSPGARTAVITVCAVVGALLLALVVLACFYCLRRRKRKNSPGKEAEREVGAPLKDNDWYHKNDSHHGYVGPPVASASHTEMAQTYPEEKSPRQSLSPVDDPAPPDLADHPAFSRDADPYTAAGVGAAGVAAEEEKRRSRSRSLGERRYSGSSIPKRKPVGTPPRTPARQNAPNSLSIDTSQAMLGGAAAISGAAAGAAYQQQRSTSHRQSAISTTSTDYFGSPRRSRHESQPEPTIASPLSSHPSNPLLFEGTRDHRRSLPSQRVYEDAADETAADSGPSRKRPQTPLGFDFGLGSGDANQNYPDHEAYSEQEPLTSEFEPQSLIAPVSKYNPTPRHSSSRLSIDAPSTNQQRSLQDRGHQYLDHAPSSATYGHKLTSLASSSALGGTAPDVPPRSPRRLSRSSFDYEQEVLTVPPRSPKRSSWHNGASKSRESLGSPTTPRDIFRDSGDYVYTSPRSAHSRSPRQSPGMGPALGYRQHGSDGTMPRFEGAGAQGRTASPYRGPGAGARSQALVHGTEHGHGYPVYGVGESGAASSVESWVSARPNQSQTRVAVPTPWDDNAIRRNSSSGNLRRMSLGDDRTAAGGESAGRERSSTLGAHSNSSRGYLPAAPNRPFETAYAGAGGYDATWGAGNVEEPVFEKYGAPQSTRRRSTSSGFDPRYGRWTDSSYDELYGTGFGVGEAL